MIIERTLLGYRITKDEKEQWWINLEEKEAYAFLSGLETILHSSFKRVVVVALDYHSKENMILVTETEEERKEDGISNNDNKGFSEP